MMLNDHRGLQEFLAFDPRVEKVEMMTGGYALWEKRRNVWTVGDIIVVEVVRHLREH